MEALDRTVWTVTIGPTDDVIFIRMRLFLDRILYTEHPIVLCDRTYQRLDLLPEGWPSESARDRKRVP